MGCPYEIQPVTGITIANGASEVWAEIPFPSRTFISKVVVSQTSGGTDGFIVDLFNSKLPRDGLPAGVPERQYKIGKAMAGITGVLEYFSDTETGGHGLSFFNLDTPPATRFKTVGERILYVRIKLSGAASGAKTFCVSVGGEAQVD